MTGREALDWLKQQNKRLNNGNGDLWLEMYINAFEKDLDKLSQLESIEKELGVDLITLFKASKNGIFVKEQNTTENEIDFEEITLDLDRKLLLFRHPRKEIGKGRVISQYCKTWWLAKDELGE